MGIADALDAATNGGVEPDVYEQPTEAFDAVVEVEPDSVLAELRQRVARTDVENTVTLELPYFGGLLWGRYKPIPVGKVLRTSRPGIEIGLDPAIAADALATACVELLRTARDGSGDLVPLDPDGEVTRYDDGLVRLLGLQPTQRTARAVVFALFRSSGRADALVLQHAGQYTQWLTGQEVAVVEGGTSDGLIDSLATAALLGVPVRRIVEGDVVERELYLLVTRRAAELRVQIMKAEAAHIASAVSRLFRRG